MMLQAIWETSFIYSSSYTSMKQKKVLVVGKNKKKSKYILSENTIVLDLTSYLSVKECPILH